MCDCVGVNPGDYTNQVMVDYPDFMSDIRDRRVAAGLSPKVCIDRCVFDEVRRLWAVRIPTIESCCGHNKRQGYIAVPAAFHGRMVDLGYERDTSYAVTDRFGFFIPKSCEPNLDQVS